MSRSHKSSVRVSGYAHPAYAASFTEFGAPRPLPRCGGWIIERRIPQADRYDAMGCYPLFSCADWSALAEDLQRLKGELVSVSVAPDPFGDHDPTLLKECFPDVCIEFKRHWVVELDQSPTTFVSPGHQRNVRKGLQNVAVEACENPSAYLEDWVRLYGILIDRHGISGLRAFSRDSFARQLEVPGILALRAQRSGRSVGMVLWYVQGDVATYHLAAYDEIGYQTRASFALFWRSIEYFRGIGLRWLNLQGLSGINVNHDGLARFKSGWATGTRTVYFCGRILDRTCYQALQERTAIPGDAYFPIYRRGEYDQQAERKLGAP